MLGLSFSLQNICGHVHCSSWAQKLPCGLLTPQPGIEPTSPALQGGFLITGPPGKSLEPFSGNHRKTYFNKMRRWELRRRKDLGSREQKIDHRGRWTSDSKGNPESTAATWRALG